MMRIPAALAALVCTALAWPAAGVGAVSSTWTEAAPRHIGSRTQYVAVYDDVRREVILAGGDVRDGSSIWTWAGTRWNRRVTPGGPVIRRMASAAFDSARGEMVVFGGGGPETGSSDQTWTWDGTSWERKTPPISPPARFGASMVYDEARKEVVLFGGSSSHLGFLGDTWTWNGESWSLRPTPGPLPRFAAHMAYDSARGQTVLFGGQVGAAIFYSGQTYDDTWIWDGLLWRPAVSAHRPPGRWIGAMSFHQASGRVVLFGGRQAGLLSLGGATSETWTWDGIDWTKESPLNVPSARDGLVLVDDRARGEAIMHGGFSSGFPPDTWAWTDSAWIRKADVLPPPRFASGMAVAGDKAVIFGGFNDEGRLGDVWTLKGSSWVRHGGPAPPTRSAHMMAADPFGRAVVFGGYDGSLLSDTWTWDGQAWTEQHPAASPPPLNWTSMALDEERNQSVLFGGADPFIEDATWLWDGTTWTQAHPAPSPSARYATAMAFDRVDRKIVMFGGEDEFGRPLGDTWTWDGQTWTSIATFAGPAPRSNAVLATDPATGRPVLIGGLAFRCVTDVFGNEFCFLDVTPETWLWTGSEWERLPDAPRALYWSAATAEAQSTILLFGGHEWLVRGETWRISTQSSGPDTVMHGAAIGDRPSGAGLVVRGRRDSRPPDTNTKSDAVER